ncbi:MAG: rod shape-determining protein MreC [Clostridiales bacterium]|nr:rod shape-determining protein MreC [Clostridiales bacterium]
MKSFLKSVRFKVLILVLMLLIGLLIYAASTGGIASLPSTVMGAISGPIQSVSSSISGAVSDFLGGIVSISEQEKRIEELEGQISELRGQLIDLDKYKQENEEFRQYLDLKEQNPDYVFEDASVISRDPSERFGGFTINKGSLAGIEAGDPVITPDGLVGFVREAGATYAKVQTLLDPSTSISSLISRTRDSGVLTANTTEFAQDGLCRLGYLDRQSSVTAGDLVITSGVGGKYPSGLVIGTISQVMQEADGISLYASVKPAADISDVRDVMVIKSFLGQNEALPPDDSSSENSGSTGESSAPDGSSSADSSAR